VKIKTLRRHLLVRGLAALAIIHVNLFEPAVWRARFAVWKARLSL